MTDPASAELRDLVHRLAGGDRSAAFALHAVLTEADDSGQASLNGVAIRFRDDYLESLRARGLDATREAGRLSLDEVRDFLSTSVLPRLTGNGIIEFPLVPEGTSEPSLRVTPTVWSQVADRRKEVADRFWMTGEHAAVTYEPRTPVAVEGVSSVLQAEGLSKAYRRRRVVDNVDVQLRQGEIVGLLGPNGAGKTTTFYMIVGLIDPLEGKIRFDGDDITRMPMYKRARRGIGYLSQEPSVFRKLTVEENIQAILETLPITKAARRDRLEALLDELNIKHLRKNKAYSLSGGERRRLEITRALVTQPKFMMLDEPFAGVDPIAVHDIQQIVAGLRHRGIGVLISDHNVEQTLDIVDRAYIMFDGQVKVSGTVRELVYDDEVSRIYLGPTLTARLRQRFTAEGNGR
ncbi:MAG TPA: LPS export ABC transporter ATP-binding protein [Gemmatimonadaceae bacterium]